MELNIKNKKFITSCKQPHKYICKIIKKKKKPYTALWFIMHVALGQEQLLISSYVNPILRPSSWAIITENPSKVTASGY